MKSCSGHYYIAASVQPYEVAEPEIHTEASTLYMATTQKQ